MTITELEKEEEKIILVLNSFFLCDASDQYFPDKPAFPMASPGFMASGNCSRDQIGSSFIRQTREGGIIAAPIPTYLRRRFERVFLAFRACLRARIETEKREKERDGAMRDSER